MGLKEIRDTFSNLVTILDKCIDLEEREKNGENVTEEMKLEQAKMMVQMMKLEAMK